MENKKHVLVVDDEEANIFMLEGVLTNEGFKVTTATNGIECLEAVRSVSNIDIILLDIMMPEMPGIEVLKRLKNNRLYKDIPVIMVSALTDSESIKSALDCGAVEYIKKPVDEVELLARIDTVLKIKDQEDELKDNLSIKDDFIRMISHDLRRPFLTISGYSQILLGDKSLSKHLNNEQKTILKYINDSSYFIVDYFNKMLAWSNLGNRELMLDIEFINLKEIIDNITLMFHPKIKEKNIKFLSKVGNIEIEADKTYFTHAISNIVSNAIKYTPEKGEIKLYVEEDEDDNDTILIISDSGEGLKQEKQLLLSSKFVKSMPGTNDEKGTGTGLYTCRRILNAHGFKLDMQSEEGKGTNVKIYIH